MVFTGTRRVPSVRNRFDLFFLDFSFYQIPKTQAFIFALFVGSEGSAKFAKSAESTKF